MITKVTIDNFKCFEHCEMELGAFNVLVGPNDSGKTAFLQALGIASLLAGRENVSAANVTQSIGFEEMGPVVRAGRRPEDLRLTISVDAGNATELAIVFDGQRFRMKVRPEPSIAASLRDASYYRFSPGALRSPSPISMSQDRPKTMLPSGDGFPTFLEDFLRADRRRFFAMEEKFRRRFPDYEIKVGKTGGANRVTFALKTGVEVPAGSVSDGAILSLAFLAATHFSDGRLLLLEEPENGVHYAALEQIVAAARYAVEDRGIQVVMTTHSPYLLDLVQPEEVRVFTKDADGAVHATKMSDSAEVKDLQRDFMTGEMWTTLSEEGIAGKVRVKP